MLSQIAIIWVLVESVLVASRKRHHHSKFLHFLHKNALLLGFIVSLVATLGSLYYSEVLNYTPCILCWYQRIFMYSQVFLFAIALVKKERKVWLFSATLSIFGAIIAALHYYSQLAGSSAFCDIVGYSASCSTNFFLTLGYISIPMMALTAFLLLLVLALIQRKSLIEY